MEGIERGFDEKPSSTDGEVHVQAHARDGGKVEVADYWRAAPGAGSESEPAPGPSKVRNLLDGAEDAGEETAEAGDAQAGADDDRPKSVSPVPNPEMRDDLEGSGRFGAKRKGHLHEGIDVLAKPGDEVVSPVDGTIVRIRPAYEDPKYEGLQAITIKGDDGREYKFLYVTPKDGDGQPTVQAKDRVSAGDPIGTVQDRAAYDRTGNMKNHVHIEIRDKLGQVVDPTPHFKRWQGKR
jgi:murein DD-endopeptidase MepM/ murein hydrolase activator NlpD